MLGHHPVLEEVYDIGQSARLALCLPGALSFVLDTMALASESPQVSEDEVWLEGED